jgi:hypothetical protein
MALGGIYDQVEGGFMRYSTDSYWKVPHFEKMLYDNAQLLSTYANAFKAYKKPLYKKVVEQTYSFLINNFRSPNGGYYSAYDADSEGEEGKYYTWTEEELKTILTKEEFEIAKKIFQITPHQKWDGKYILWQDKTNEALAQQMHISADEFEEIREKIRQKLLKERRKRVKPGLDNKILASWNALLIKGFADAFTATGNTEFLTEAENIYSFIEKNYLNKKTLELVHIKSNKNAIEANLDDYALLIQAVIRLYEITLNEKYLITANQLTGFVNKHFTDEENTFYYYTSDTKAQNLIVRKKELSDNVIPSSNAVMAHNLHYLSIVMENETFENRVKKMTVSLQTYVSKVPSAYAMWASAITKEVFPFKETVIIGPKAIDFNIELNKNYVANVLWAGGKTLNNSIPILKDRGSLPETYIYICQNKTCKKPVSTIKEALELLN